LSNRDIRTTETRDEVLEKRAAEHDRLKQNKEQLKRDRTTLLARPDFQRVMHDILARGGMFRSVMTGNSMTYYKSGQQDFTREIFEDMVRADRDKAFDLLKPNTGESDG
jgi:uncharacterized protein YaaR (DUF327 family)